MNRPQQITAVVFALLVAVLVLRSHRNDNEDGVVEAIRAPLAVWSNYEGTLESRVPAVVTSRLRTNAAIVELVSDGTRITRGSLVARLDVAPLEKELIRLDRDFAAAHAGLDSLRQATAPLELRDLQKKVTDAEAVLVGEKNYLAALTKLADEGVASTDDITRQQARVDSLAKEFDTVTLRLQLTAEHIQPASIREAQAKLAAVAAERKVAREQLEHGVIRAPVDGVVVHGQLYLGTEYRTARIGDIIFPNQPFMSIADMKDLVVQTRVPEAELALARVGSQAYINPVAFPGLQLLGTIESVSPMAQNTAGYPVWEKSFTMIIALKAWDERLRPGMSVTAQVLSNYSPAAVSVPRAAVFWQNGNPYAKIVGEAQPRPLKLGMANDTTFEIVEGVVPGDKLLAP